MPNHLKYILILYLSIIHLGLGAILAILILATNPSFHLGITSVKGTFCGMLLIALILCLFAGIAGVVGIQLEFTEKKINHIASIYGPLLHGKRRRPCAL
jgi:hypothetical protein